MLFWRYRTLVWKMSMRDLIGRNKGSVLGLLWIALVPLVQTFAYIIMIGVVQKVRLGEGVATFDYAVYVLTGQVSWAFIARALQEAPMILRARVELVKQVVYPIETLPLTSLINAGVSSLVALAVALAVGSIQGLISYTALLLAVPLIILLVFLIGVSWMFMIAGVLLKDLSEIVALILGLMVFFSPVLMKPDMVNPFIWQVMLLNPLAHIVIAFRDVLYGEFHALSWGIFVGMALVALLVGHGLLQRTKLIINEYI